jgi:5-methyltetrahydrofolate--homocysteine methyltransferase
VLVIGERINSSIKKIEAAIQDKNTDLIKNEAKSQLDAGAHVIDLNAGAFLRSESEYLVWLIQTVFMLDKEQMLIAIDSANPEAIAAGLEEIQSKSKITKDAKPIVNSVTAEKEKMDSVMPLVKKYNAQLVGLCMDQHGIPDEPERRLDLGTEIINTAKEYEIPLNDLYLDPLVLPVSTDTKKGRITIDTLKLIKGSYPAVNTIIGLSNISYGLPVKPLLNQTFMVLAMSVGLNAAILNPLDMRLISMIKAADVILGNDDYCLNYIKAFRAGELSD